MKILIVSQDAELAVLTGKTLNRRGYDVSCCCDVSEISALIEREEVHLVIADLEIDQEERLQFCKTVKNTQNPPELLFLSGNADEESSILNAGADDWIKKPYKTSVFLARISALLRRGGNDLKSQKVEVFLS